MLSTHKHTHTHENTHMKINTEQMPISVLSETVLCLTVLLKKYLFIWPCRVLVVAYRVLTVACGSHVGFFLAAHGLSSSGMRAPERAGS